MCKKFKHVIRNIYTPPKTKFLKTKNIYFIDKANTPLVGTIGVGGMSRTKAIHIFIYYPMKFSISNYRSGTTVYYLMDNNNG